MPALKYSVPRVSSAVLMSERIHSLDSRLSPAMKTLILSPP